MQNDEFAVFISTLDPFVMLVVFAVVGYIAGSWVYKKNFYTAVVVLFVIPYLMLMLIWINAVVSATLPFLLFAVIGYIGVDKSKYYALETPYLFKQLIRKIGNNNE